MTNYATNNLRSIEDLPAEIVLIIFKFVFMGSRIGTFRVGKIYSCTNPKLRTPCDCHEKPFKTTWIEEDCTNPCIFPCATSLVCSRWRSLMETVPIVETRHRICRCESNTTGETSNPSAPFWRSPAGFLHSEEAWHIRRSGS